MDPVLARLLAVAAGVLVTALVGRVVRARRDRMTAVTSPATPTPAPVDDATDGRTDTGPSALLFGSPTCAPCDTLKLLLAEVAEQRDDFSWAYVDAAEHLDLARAHGVRTVPTLLVLDPTGTVVSRSGGVPSRPELAAAVAGAAGEGAAGGTTTLDSSAATTAEDVERRSA